MLMTWTGSGAGEFAGVEKPALPTFGDETGISQDTAEQDSL